MLIVDWIKGVVSKMFSRSDIKKIIKHDIALTDTMISAIEDWKFMLYGQAYWLDDSITSLRLERSIIKEFADIALNEMTASITNQKLDEAFKKVTKDLNEQLQIGLALGSFIVKPLGEDTVEYVMADSFIPVEFDSYGRLIKVVFVETRTISDNKYYRRLEYHSIDENGLVVTNTAYVSNSKSDIGRQTSLSVVADWGKLPPVIMYEGVTCPIFGYYRNPIPNTIDGSPCGISIYDSAVNLIKRADIQYSRLDWEFESGERAIHIDITALKKETMTDGTTREYMPSLNKRLYRGVDIDADNLIDVFSPEFREQSILNGFNEFLRRIEFNVGLSYGDISNPDTIDKTATEIKSSKQRKYNTVTAIQSNLKDCLDDLAFALAFYNRLTQSGYELVCDFKDSILTDEQAERQQDIQDMANGTLRPEEYRSKWRSETLEDALKNLPEQAKVME